MKVHLSSREAQSFRDAGFTIPDDAYVVSRDDFTPEEVARANAVAESLGYKTGGAYAAARKIMDRNAKRARDGR